MKLNKSTLNATKNIMIERRIKTLVNEGLNKDQISAKLIEEGFGDFIRKGIDTVKKKTGLGISMGSREARGQANMIMSDYGEFLVREFPTEKEIALMIRVFEERGQNRGDRAMASGGYANALDKLPKNKQANLRKPMLLRKQIREFIKKLQAIEVPGGGDKTRKKALQVINAATENLEGKLQYLRDLDKAFRAAEKTGETEAVERLAAREREEDRKIARASKLAFMKQQDDIAKDDREMRRKARNQKQPEDIIRGKSTERFGLGTRGSGG